MFFEIVLFLVPLLVYYLNAQWKKRKQAGIPFLPFRPPFGHLQKVITREKSFGLAINEFYADTDERLVGIHMIFKPAIMVRDPEIVKMMMTTHFEYFSDRGLHPDAKKNPLSASLFAMELDQWKPLRAKLTPAFSGAKIRQMMSQVQSISKTFQQELEKLTADKPEVDIKMKSLSSCYIVDIIASTIYGIEVNSLSNDNHPFRKLGSKLSEVRNRDFLEAWRLACIFLWPKLSRFLGLGDMPKFISDYFVGLVRSTIESREQSKEVRHDVMQMLLQLRNTGSLENDSWTAADNKTTTPFLSIEECAANAFLFYVAGSESSSSSICFCLFELSREQDHLKTVQEEIDRVLEAHNGEITYEALASMKFLDKCVVETLRKYPALPMLNRRCTKEFKVPDTNQIIYQNQTIVIPLRSIQTDARYFPNPMKFNPNRSDPDDPDYSSTPYYGFGEGPKSCIAYRLGSIMVKAGLVSLLSKYDLKKTTDSELDFSIGDLGMLPRNDFTLRVSRRP